MLHRSDHSDHGCAPAVLQAAEQAEKDVLREKEVLH